MLIAAAAMLVLALGAALFLVLTGAFVPESQIPEQRKTESPAEPKLDGAAKQR
ncbi:hypothetical protein [Amycolatopsis nigrescens]|uniref:hypothetical protein n=1 Tax=Amycolatopsis nigrescens TaxID=381445 RepID=UPI00035FE1E3|nr:hypothetical protein [Amycolatopsis nigrescens]